MRKEPILRLDHVTKRFGHNEVLRGIDLTIHDGEAVGLIGDNGAGKSTLVKILSGVHQPTSGEIKLGGATATFRGPLEARNLGVEVIHQDLGLCDDLDATSNIFLGRERRYKLLGVPFLRTTAMRAEAKRLLERLGTDIPLDRPVGSMSGGQRQLVAAARALQFNPRILLMDEPTAALSNTKVHHLLRLVENLRDEGVSVLLISHRFTDIIEVCNRILILRDGIVVGEIEPDGQRSATELMGAMQSALSGELVDK